MDLHQEINWKSVVVAPEYDRAIKIAGVWQVVFALLAALTLDLGQIRVNMGVCLPASWLLFAMIVCRRPLKPTAADLRIVKWGTIPFGLLAFLYP